MWGLLCCVPAKNPPDTFSTAVGDFAKCGGNSPSNTYNTTQSKIDGDLRKFLHFIFIPHTTRKSKTAKQDREISFRPPSTDNSEFC